MELCSNGHTEICYSDRSCPLCLLEEKATNEEENLRSKILDLENLVEQQSEQIDNMKNEIVALNENDPSRSER